MNISHSPLLHAIALHAQNSPDKVAVIASGASTTYHQLYDNIQKSASWLVELGVKQGDKVIITATKDIEFVYLYFASHIIGSVNVIVDASMNKDRLKYIENKVCPVWCLGYASSAFPSKSFDELGLDRDYIRSEDIPKLHICDNAEILFTTGTTGDPKGVCLSYGNIYASASNINAFIRNTCEDIELLALPVCHSFGLGRLRCMMLVGGTIILLGSFANVRLFLNLIEKYQVTGFGVVPAAWAYIRKISGRRMEKYADQIRYIEIGSAAMPIDTKMEMLEMFPAARICMHYGLTEASRSTFIEFHDKEHLSSIGKPVSSQVDVKIFNNDGCEALIGSVGELCVKGNMVMSNYLDDTHMEEAFWGEYFRTGDSGYCDTDGYLYLVGREKELINVGGKKVSPMEVEDCICSLGVGDCVCVGMPDQQGILGEVVKAYILKGSTSLTFEEISNMIATRLEPYKRPVAFEWIDSIPMTSSGKKQRIKLRNL